MLTTPFKAAVVHEAHIFDWLQDGIGDAVPATDWAVIMKFVTYDEGHVIVRPAAIVDELADGSTTGIPNELLTMTGTELAEFIQAKAVLRALVDRGPGGGEPVPIHRTRGAADAKL